MKYRWVVMLAALLLVGWLWISWKSGWFPFGALHTTTQQGILDSLTAKGSPMSDTTDILKQLTATSTVNAANDASILDSLTPPKK